MLLRCLYSHKIKLSTMYIIWLTNNLRYDIIASAKA